jgi:polyisoprenyl-phosphate glycosyltransferase
MGKTIAGWTSVVVIMLTLGGIQLTVLGIIGEYLGRLFGEVKRRPLYIIEEVRARR